MRYSVIKEHWELMLFVASIFVLLVFANDMQGYYQDLDEWLVMNAPATMDFLLHSVSVGAVCFFALWGGLSLA